MSTALLLMHLPPPVGWIALTPDDLRAAQRSAIEAVGVNVTENRHPSTATTVLLTAEVAATLLSVDASWLLTQAREGRVPCVKLGKYIRFDPAAIVEQCARLGRPVASASAVQRTRPLRQGR